jgi:hypothetical protein
MEGGGVIFVERVKVKNVMLLGYSAHMDMVDNVTVTLPLLNKLLFSVTTTIRWK